MKSFSTIALLTRVAAFAAAGLVACGNGVEPEGVPSTSAGGGGGADPGTGGDEDMASTSGDGAFVTDGSGGGGSEPFSCAFPTAGDIGASAALQAFCEPGAPNPPDCPSSEPTPGDPCSIDALQCAYEQDGSSYLLHTCIGSWNQAVRGCALTCDDASGAVPLGDDPACGSLPDIPCETATYGTDQERADATLHEILHCCNHPETNIVVSLKDGCATASAGPPDVVACVNALLAGRRIQCAKALSCIAAEWSTVD